MTRKQKKMLARIVISAVLLVAAVLIPYSGTWRFLLFFPAYFTIGWDVLWKAARNIAHGQVFDENFLMALATVGAFCTGFFGEGEYPEAVFVMLFYQVGELFQSYAVGKSRKSIASLMDIRPDYANVERDGQLVQVDPEQVAIGDVITVKAGEKVPLDGVVLEGSSSLNTAALTGESLPREVGPGDSVISGCVNQSGLLRVQVTKAFGESTVAKILDLVENSSSKKAKAENFITKFAGTTPQSWSSPPWPWRCCRPCSLAKAGRTGSSGPDLPGGLLPLRPGDLRAPQLLRGHRRGLPAGHPGEGRQLSGGPGRHGSGGVR